MFKRKDSKFKKQAHTQKRNLKYRKKVQIKPNFMRLFIRKFTVLLAEFALISFLITLWFENWYENEILYMEDSLATEIYTKLDDIDFDEDQDIQFLYNKLEYASSLISSVPEQKMYWSNRFQEKLREIFYGKEMDCFRISFLDENENVVCYSGRAAYLTCSYIEDGEKRKNIFVCENICEKYGKDVIYTLNSGRVYIKGAQFEPCVEGKTKEEELTGQGYQCVDLEGAVFMDLKSGFEERSKTIPVRSSWSDNDKITIGGHEFIIAIDRCDDMWYDFGRPLIFLYISMGIMALIISLLISYRKYITAEAQYQSDLYRRTIMNSMAHDLKSPLMVISGYTQNLIAGTNPDKNEYYLQKIQDTVSYMDKTIVNILDLSKSENIHMSKDRKEILLHKSIEDISQKYKHFMTQNGISINLTGECKVICNETWMYQMIDNLLGNAMKYAIKDSTVEVVLNEKEMTIRNQFDGEIAAEPEQLLEPFVKGDNARQEQKGNGVGLSIVKNICDNYGYSFTIEINENEFLVRIVFS